MKILFLLLPIIFVVSSSGCTDFCIPGLNCGSVEKETPDLLIFESITAVPDTISPMQSSRVRAYVKNKIEENVLINSISMYDACEGVFNVAGVSCNTAAGEQATCNELYISAGNIMPITWTLNANPNIKLSTPCAPKIKLSYITSTYSATSIKFISPDLLKRLADEGQTESAASDIRIGTGPIRAYFTVEDNQPIPTDVGKTVIALNIKNEGAGYMKNNKICVDNIKVYAGADELNYGNVIDGALSAALRECKRTWGIYVDGSECSVLKDTATKKTGNYIEVIGNRPVKIICTIDLTTEIIDEKGKTTTLKDVLSNRDEATLILSLELNDYEYEIRGETKITVEPPILGN